MCLPALQMLNGALRMDFQSVLHCPQVFIDESLCTRKVLQDEGTSKHIVLCLIKGYFVHYKKKQTNVQIQLNTGTIN